jgi:hypothetical protein
MRLATVMLAAGLALAGGAVIAMTQGAAGPAPTAPPAQSLKTVASFQSIRDPAALAGDPRPHPRR